MSESTEIEAPVFECDRVFGQLQFSCPRCGKKNIHGGGRSAGDGDGHRVAHCKCWPSGYYVKERSIVGGQHSASGPVP